MSAWLKMKKACVMLGMLIMLTPLTVQATEVSNEQDQTEVKETPRIYDVEWQSLSDTELNVLLDEMTDAELTEFLFSLSDDDLYDIIERDTLLAYPVYGVDIPEIDTEEAHDTYVKYDHYYEKVFRQAITPFDWDNATENYQGTADGRCYVKIINQETNQLLSRWRITINDIYSGEYVLSGGQVEIEERTSGQGMIVTQVKADKTDWEWAGIRIIGSYTLPAHYQTYWQHDGEVWMGRFNPWNEAYSYWSVDTGHYTYNTTDYFDIQVNAFHWGGIEGTDGGGEGAILLQRHRNVVTINPNGGTWNGSTATQTINKLCKDTSSIPVPTRSRYRFTGWTLTNGTGANGSISTTQPQAATYTHCNSGATAVIDNETVTYKNSTTYSTLTANWVEDKYKVTVTAGTGIESVSGGGDHFVGDPVTIDAVVKPGYTWGGWTGTYTSSTKNYTFTMPSNAVSMTASGIPNTYQVKYNPNDPNTSDAYSTTGSMSNSVHTYDQYKNLTLNAFGHRGYQFKNWNTVANGTGTSYSNGQSVANLTTTNNAVVNLYAQWTPVTYTVTYHGNTHTSGSMSASTHTYDQTSKLSINKYGKTGYLFTGWNTKADGSGTSYSDGQSILNLAYTQGANIDLYAQWIPITYTLRYDNNIGRYTKSEAAGPGSSTTLTYDKNYTVENYGGNPNNFTCNTDNYRFDHWDTNSNDTAKDYKPGENAVNLTTVNNATVTMYAQYKVRFEVYHYFQDDDGTYPKVPDSVDVGYELVGRLVGASYIKNEPGYFAPYANRTGTPSLTIPDKNIAVDIDYEKNEIHYFYPKTDFNVYIDPNTGEWRGSKDVTPVNVRVGSQEDIELPKCPYSGTLRIFFDDSLTGPDTLVAERPVDKIFDGWTHKGGGEFTNNKTGDSLIAYAQDGATLQAVNSGDAYLTANYVIGYYQLKKSDVPAPREHYKFLGWNIDPTVYPNPDIYWGDDAIYDPVVDAKYQANPKEKVTDYVVGDKIYILEDENGKTWIYENNINTWIEANIYEVWRVDFDLDTLLTRVLKPDGSEDPGFRAGEAGEILIGTIGFIDEMEVTFPGKLHALDNSLSEHRDINPLITDLNKKNFSVPLYAPTGSYTITITVWSKSYQDPLKAEHEIVVRKDDDTGPPWWDDPSTDSIAGDIKTRLE